MVIADNKIDKWKQDKNIHRYNELTTVTDFIWVYFGITDNASKTNEWLKYLPIFFKVK